MIFPSPTPRRVRAPSWLDLRLLLGVALVLAAVVLGAVVVSRARHTEPIVRVTRDLAAGSVLRADELGVVEVQLPDGGRPVYVADQANAVGRTLNRDLRAGELLPAGAISATGARTTLSVPFAADAAPPLSSGQRIEVWLSTPSCPSVVLLDSATVQQAQSASLSALSGADGQQVVLSLGPALAQRVVGALALDGASIRAGVLSPGSPAASALPSLQTCGGPSGAPSR